MAIRTYYSRQNNKIAYKYGPIALAAPFGSVKNINGVREYISNETKIDTVQQVCRILLQITRNRKNWLSLKMKIPLHSK